MRRRQARQAGREPWADPSGGSIVAAGWVGGNCRVDDPRIARHSRSSALRHVSMKRSGIDSRPECGRLETVGVAKRHHDVCPSQFCEMPLASLQSCSTFPESRGLKAKPVLVCDECEIRLRCCALRRLQVIVPAVLFVLASASYSEAQTLNQKIVTFLSGKAGTRIGGGECAHVATEALRVAGAEFTSTDLGADSPSAGDYVWETLIKTVSVTSCVRTERRSPPSVPVLPTRYDVELFHPLVHHDFDDRSDSGSAQRPIRGDHQGRRLRNLQRHGRSGDGPQADAVSRFKTALP